MDFETVFGFWKGNIHEGCLGHYLHEQLYEDLCAYPTKELALNRKGLNVFCSDMGITIK